MFYNPDFEGTPNGLMSLAVICAYNALFAYSKVLGFTWVDTSTGFRGAYSSAPLNPDLFYLILTLLPLIPGLYISIKRCTRRIKLGKISTKQAIKAYFKHLSIFCIALIIMIICVPIVTPYLRGWKSIF